MFDTKDTLWLCSLTHVPDDQEMFRLATPSSESLFRIERGDCKGDTRQPPVRETSSGTGPLRGCRLPRTPTKGILRTPTLDRTNPGQPESLRVRPLRPSEPFSVVFFRRSSPTPNTSRGSMSRRKSVWTGARLETRLSGSYPETRHSLPVLYRPNRMDGPSSTGDLERRTRFFCFGAGFKFCRPLVQSSCQGVVSFIYGHGNVFAFVLRPIYDLMNYQITLRDSQTWRTLFL